MRECTKPPRDWLQIGLHNSRAKSTPSAALKSTWTLFSPLIALAEINFKKTVAEKLLWRASLDSADRSPATLAIP
jgi:hypothetical protein